MPPTRRQLRALGSLQLVGYANNPTKVITELAFITDEHMNNALMEGGRLESDAPLEVRFNELMDGVNSRGRGTKTRQRKMTVEQAAAVLLVTVQKGHVELIAKENEPQTIDVIKILPEAKRILATFLPKLRGYGDIPYDQQYRGAIALAKRHFFPKGRVLTKKELMALLLQSYHEKRMLSSRCQTQFQPTSLKTLGIQTSLASIGGPPSCAETASGESTPGIHPAAGSTTAEEAGQSNSQSRLELPDDVMVAVDVESTPVASKVELYPDLDGGNHGAISEPERAACTPVAPRSFNPYMTPVSNPRRIGHTADTPALPHASPARTDDSDIEDTPNEDNLTDEGIGELLQTTTTTQGRLNYYYNEFITACQKITFLEGQKEEMQREFDLTKRQLDETEQHLRVANADRGRLSKWVDTLLRRVDSIYGQLGLLRGMTCPEAVDGEEWSVYDPALQETFDPHSI